eukprot:Awhi_evm1s6437
MLGPLSLISGIKVTQSSYGIMPLITCSWCYSSTVTLHAYADTDLGGTKDHKSTSGMRLTSTTEAELISLSHACKEVNWLRNILAGLNFPLSAPTIIYQDSQPAIAVIRRQGTHQRTKYFSRNVMGNREETK